MAVKDGRCYPANGPRAEQLPPNHQNVSIIPRTTKSPYFDEQLYDSTTEIQQFANVYIDASQTYNILVANKENQHFEAYNGIAHFDAITVTANGVTFENISATNFVWYTATDTSSCKNCNNVKLLPRPNRRFFTCRGSPTFTGINARVLAPQCKCNFTDGSVIILRDRSSPHQYYSNISLTDLTVSSHKKNPAPPLHWHSHNASLTSKSLDQSTKSPTQEDSETFTLKNSSPPQRRSASQSLLPRELSSSSILPPSFNASDGVLSTSTAALDAPLSPTHNGEEDMLSAEEDSSTTEVAQSLKIPSFLVSKDTPKHQHTQSHVNTEQRPLHHTHSHSSDGQYGIAHNGDGHNSGDQYGISHNGDGDQYGISHNSGQFSLLHDSGHTDMNGHTPSSDKVRTDLESLSLHLESAQEQTSSTLHRRKDSVAYSHKERGPMSDAVKRAIARGRDTSKHSIVATVHSAEQNIIAAINDLKQSLTKRERKPGPPFF